MQSISQTTSPTRTKSASLFIPKSHKSSCCSVIGSISPIPIENKHTNPNRARVVAVEIDFAPTPIPTVSRKRKSPDCDKSSSSSSHGPESSSPKKRMRKTPDRDESSTSSTSRRVEGPSRLLMKAARRDYNKVATRRKIGIVPQLIDPLARVCFVSPHSEKATSHIPNVDVVCEETPTKPLALARPHPRTKTALFMPRLVRKPSGPSSLAEYARRMSEANSAPYLAHGVSIQ